MPDLKFHCTDCGKCCLEGAGRLKATESDIRMWETETPYLLDYVRISELDGQRTGELWVTPRAPREEMTRCPWIRKRPGEDRYYCRIYEYRPQVCRSYPTSPEHATYTDCDGTFTK